MGGKDDKKPARPRNPFAGRRRSGAGAHTERKYSKKNRRRLKKETEEEAKREK